MCVCVCTSDLPWPCKRTTCSFSSPRKKGSSSKCHSNAVCSGIYAGMPHTSRSLFLGCRALFLGCRSLLNAVCSGIYAGMPHTNRSLFLGCRALLPVSSVCFDTYLRIRMPEVCASVKNRPIYMAKKGLLTFVYVRYELGKPRHCVGGKKRKESHPVHDDTNAPTTTKSHKSWAEHICRALKSEVNLSLSLPPSPSPSLSLCTPVVGLSLSCARSLSPSLPLCVRVRVRVRARVRVRVCCLHAEALSSRTTPPSARHAGTSSRRACGNARDVFRTCALTNCTMQFEVFIRSW